MTEIEELTNLIAVANKETLEKYGIVLKAGDILFGEPLQDDENPALTYIIGRANRPDLKGSMRYSYYRVGEANVIQAIGEAPRADLDESAQVADCVRALRGRYGLNVTSENFTDEESSDPEGKRWYFDPKSLRWYGSIRIIYDPSAEIETPLVDALPNVLLDGLTYLKP